MDRKNSLVDKTSILNLCYDDISDTPCPYLKKFRKIKSSILYGLVDITGKVFKSEQCVRDSNIWYWELGEHKILQIYDEYEEYFKIYKIIIENNKLRFKLIYSSKTMMVYKLYENVIVLHYCTHAYTVIDYSGHRNNKKELYSKIIRHKGTSDFICVKRIGFNKTERKFHGGGITILDKYGRIKCSDIAWGKEEWLKYRISEADLYYTDLGDIWGGIWGD